MNKRTLSSASAAALTCFACGVTWWSVFRLTTGVTYEDALITYRYAQNLASGNGFVFNIGQQVLGTTTPLLTLFLAVVGKALGLTAIPLAATLTMASFGILTGIAVYYILGELKYSAMTRIASIPFFFGNALILVSSVGGMETPLVLFCMAGSALAMLRRQPMACLLTCAVLVLTRPDGVIWAGAMSLALIFQDRRIPWRACLAASGVVLPWIAFSTWYFGSPLPHSVVAKQVIGSSSSLPPRISLAGIESFSRWYIGFTGFGLGSSVLSLWLIILALGAISYLIRSDRRTLGVIIIGYPLLYGAFLYGGKAPHFQWYLTPPALCAVLLAAPGLLELSGMISERLPRGRRGVKIGSVVGIVVVLCVFLAQNRHVVRLNRDFQANEIHTRRAIGIWLRDNSPGDSVVAMEAVGYQAFFSERAIIDLAGLVSPAVVALRQATSSNAEHFFRIMSTMKPDYVVLRSFEVDENRHFHGGTLFETNIQRAYFTSKYAERKRFSAPYPQRWGESSFLTIYKRMME